MERSMFRSIQGKVFVITSSLGLSVKQGCLARGDYDWHTNNSAHHSLYMDLLA